MTERRPYSVTQHAAHFFHPRMVHLPPQYRQLPGLIIADWRDRDLAWHQKLLRNLQRTKRQDSPSAAGLSKLSYELLFLIFKELCGREILSTRLVCTEWELANRPFFAERYLTRSLFSLTSSGLRDLENFTTKFGPYMQKIFIATDQFTRAGFWRSLRRYLRHTKVIARLHPPRPDHCYAHYYKCHPKPYFDHVRTRRFLLHFASNVCSQLWLSLSSQDVARLSRLAGTLPPNIEVRAVDISYVPERLNNNVQIYGRAGPRFAQECALLCAKSGRLGDGHDRPHLIKRLQHPAPCSAHPTQHPHPQNPSAPDSNHHLVPPRS